MDFPSLFRYRVLRDPSREVRLLKLLGDGDKAKPLQCQLNVYNLDGEYPDFAAISYTWGTSRKPRHVLINGYPFTIRDTAWELLRELQTLALDCDPRPEFYWIDSLCINQGSIRERNEQVRLMRRIYSSARLVLAWLGVSSPSSNLAMENLAKLKHYRLSKTVPSRKAAESISGKNRSSPIAFGNRRMIYGKTVSATTSTYQGDERAMNLTLDANASKAILRLLRNSFWERIWIIQEVLLARDIRLLYGSKYINWDQLNSYFGGLEFHRLASGDQFHKSERVRRIMDTPAYRLVKEKAYFENTPHLKERGLPISDLLQSFGSFQCTDSRDKVYGVLGISSDKIDIDYGKSLQHIYNDVLRCVVRTTQVDTMAKAEVFARRFANSLGLHITDAQLINADTLFYTPPRALRWTDPRPFWERDLAGALPQSYLNHMTSALSLSMTPANTYRALARNLLTLMNQSTPQMLESENATTSLTGVSLGTVLDSEASEDEHRLSYDFSDGLSTQIIRPVSDARPSLIQLVNTNTGPTFTSEDDIAVRMEPTSQVDYLSHEWEEEDLWSSWRHIVEHRKVYGEQSRIENAAWRTWAQNQNNLSRISPETLNWLKEVDVTWLYGPMLPSSANRRQTTGTSRKTQPTTDDMKPSLKKRALSEIILKANLKHQAKVGKPAKSSPSVEFSDIVEYRMINDPTSRLASPTDESDSSDGSDNWSMKTEDTDSHRNGPSSFLLETND